MEQVRRITSHLPIQKVQQAYRAHKGTALLAISLIAYVVLGLYFMISTSSSFGKFSIITNYAIIIGGVLLLLAQLFKKTTVLGAAGQSTTTQIMQLAKHILSLFLGLFIVGILLYYVFNISFYSEFFTFILTSTIAVTGLYLIYRATKGTAFVQSILRNRYVSILYHLIFYIPCVLFDSIEALVFDVKNTSSFIYWILVAEIALIALYKILPALKAKIFTHDSTVLLNKPIYTDKKTTIGTFENLKDKQKKTGASGENDEFKYNYGLSAWIFLDNVGKNYNAKSNEFTSVLSYGEKPAIQYNPSSQTFRIITKEGMDGIKIVYETSDIPIQRWNHVVVNYDGGNTDVFVNSKLVASIPGVIPYMTHDNVVVGEEDGIPGGVANVQYYDAPLNKVQIDTIYEYFKNKNPPSL